MIPVREGADIDFKRLDVERLLFAYENNDTVLSDVSMHVKQGEIVGIVGQSGCGKSTLLKLLLRFWQKQDGRIYYNGKRNKYCGL